jgi:hypothetical protein
MGVAVQQVSIVTLIISLGLLVASGRSTPFRITLPEVGGVVHGAGRQPSATARTPCASGSGSRWCIPEAFHPDPLPASSGSRPAGRSP